MCGYSSGLGKILREAQHHLPAGKRKDANQREHGFSYLAHVCLSWKRSYRYEETESFAKMCRFRGMQKGLALGHNRVPM